MYTADYFKDVLGQSISVRLAARSFIIPIPKADWPVMTYPFDIAGQPEMKKGMPLRNSKREEKGPGIVFINHTDGAVQGARSNGKEMIIVNGISTNQAAKLFHFYKATIANPEQATEADIRKVLHYAHVELGIEDFFNGDCGKIPGFEPEDRHPGNRDCGVFIRRSNEERFALLGIGSGTFQGPASSPQRFTENVGVASNAKHAWLVQTETLLLTYRHPDDRELKITDLPTFEMREGAAPVLAPSLG